MNFSEDEIAAVKKFFGWIEEGNWLDGYREGITGASDEGITVTEYSAYTDYGDCSIEREETVIPWLAMADPAEYQRQEDARKAEEKRQWEAQRQAQIRAREAQERATYQALKAKYG